MSVTTYPTTPALPVRTTNMTTNFSRILKGEWTKLRTLPSTWRTAVFALVFSIGTGAILVHLPGQSVAHHDACAAAQTFDATSCSLFGIMIAAVLLGSLALRSVTAEYASGMIRSTFTAMPTRRLVLAGKAAIVAAFAFPVALVSNFVAFEIGQRIFAGKHLQVTLGHPGVLRRSSSALWQSASSPSSESVSAASFDTPQGRPRRWRSSSSEESRSASFFRRACVGTCPAPPSRRP